MENKEKSKNEVLDEILSLLQYLANLVKILATEEEPAEESPITLEKVRAILSQISKDGFSEQIHALIKSYGEDNLTKIDPKNYKALLKQAEEIQNA